MEAKGRRSEKPVAPQRRVIVVGKRQDGRWKVRMSLWRYLAATAISQ
jgi:ketosteroid isomerase-like protein